VHVVNYVIIIIRPHRSTVLRIGRRGLMLPTDCEYRGLSVCRSVCHISKPCKHGCTDRDFIWVEDLGGPKEPCIRWGLDPPWEGAILRREKGVPL